MVCQALSKTCNEGDRNFYDAINHNQNDYVKICVDMNAPTTDVNETSANIVKSSIPHRVYSEEEAFLHMTRKRPEKEQLLYSIVDEILFNVWDALCLSIDLEFREAYLPYLPHAFDLLITTENGLELYDYLVFVEETKMGTFMGDALARRRASMAVDVLLGYRQSIFANGRDNPTSEQ